MIFRPFIRGPITPPHDANASHSPRGDLFDPQELEHKLDVEKRKQRERVKVPGWEFASSVGKNGLKKIHGKKSPVTLKAW